MALAKNGDTVKVHFTGKLENGTTFDSSSGGEPLELTIGDGKLIPGFEGALLGMKVGESKNIRISTDEGYGAHDDDLVMTVEKSELPSDLDPGVGEELEIQQDDKTFPVTVTEVSANTVTLDANHPLAGEVLIFEIELTEIL